MMNVLIEPLKNCDVPRDGLEILRLIESCIHGWINIVFPRIYMRKLAININSAIDDWLISFTKKEYRVTMMAYARTGRLVTLTHVSVASIGSILWFASVFLSNKEKVVLNRY